MKILLKKNRTLQISAALAAMTPGLILVLMTPPDRGVLFGVGIILMAGVAILTLWVIWVAVPLLRGFTE